MEVAASAAERAAVDDLLGPPQSSWDGAHRTAGDGRVAFGGCQVDQATLAQQVNLAAILQDELFHKRTHQARLVELFPYGYVKQTCKIAGMKRPRAWSTG